MRPDNSRDADLQCVRTKEKMTVDYMAKRFGRHRHAVWARPAAGIEGKAVRVCV